MENCIPPKDHPKRTYEQIEIELHITRQKSADRKRALRNANHLIQDLQIKNSNLSWKAKMWEKRALRLGWFDQQNPKPWWSALWPF